ncbi:hypothetical protein PAAG_03867 [Paracoccidioides lutzii Pb01]|uniref:Uncharacterized protein n=1 Tax=Paracoccidioides lutzii (strain ATCC MYA-826 / Pb01) TaxID=502779 RepID=C1GZC3_PARBA|nr:hypothetical protein PAAG_03867 [Paracoccidioides lutzii Pb01]EEH41946.2 hypothetical protein PAAG_03867 [Paracoccidioides lutzii Pb01]
MPMPKRSNQIRARPSTFPLMRLPLEIRENIYRFLLEPLSGSCYEDLPEMAGENGIRFRISEAAFSCFCHEQDFTHSTNQPNGHIPGEMEDLFELYKAIREGTADDAEIQRGEELRLTERFETNFELDLEEVESGSTSGDDDHDSDSEVDEGYFDDIVNCENKLPRHTRGIRGECRPVYELQVYRGHKTDTYPRYSSPSQRTTPHHKYICWEFRTLEFLFLRRLFHVSHQFTREIARCLWKNAILNFEDPECFFSFIADRYAILGFIKCIELHLQFYDDWFDTSSETVVAICQFVSEFMHMRYIKIHFGTERSCLEKVITGERLERWKTAFNELKVTQGFELSVYNCPVSVPHKKMGTALCSSGDMKKKLEDLWRPAVLAKQG